MCQCSIHYIWYFSAKLSTEIVCFGNILTRYKNNIPHHVTLNRVWSNAKTILIAVLKSVPGHSKTVFGTTEDNKITWWFIIAGFSQRAVDKLVYACSCMAISTVTS